MWYSELYQFNNWRGYRVSANAASNSNQQILPADPKEGDMLFWNGNEWGLVEFKSGSEGALLTLIEGVPVWKSYNIQAGQIITDISLSQQNTADKREEEKDDDEEEEEEEEEEAREENNTGGATAGNTPGEGALAGTESIVASSGNTPFGTILENTYQDDLSSLLSATTGALEAAESEIQAAMAELEAAESEIETVQHSTSNLRTDDVFIDAITDVVKN